MSKTYRKEHFLVWYRLVPLALVCAFGLIAFVYSNAPAAFFRPLYPLKYESAIQEASERYSVDPFLVCAVIKAESNWDPTVASNQGAQGLMQLMPETAQDMLDKGIVSRSFSAVDLEDPRTNIEFGCAYLSYLLKYFNGSTDRAIAAYNAGMANVNTWASQKTVLHNAITFPETQAYLIRVNNALSRYRVLYPDAFQ